MYNFIFVFKINLFYFCLDFWGGRILSTCQIGTSLSMYIEKRKHGKEASIMPHCAGNDWDYDP